jgi:hypothetical protein
MSPMPRAAEQQGIALIVVLLAMSLLMALGLALVLNTMTEARISGHYRVASEARYAADAAVERVIPDILATAKVNDLLSGAQQSGFVDGEPGGIRALPDGSALDLTEATNILRCGKSACGEADLIAISDDRPWGRNNPVWQPYAYGRLDHLLPADSINSQMYVVVWVADDLAENDGDPLHDGGPPVGCDLDNEPDCASRNPGRGALSLLAQAFGPDGTRSTIEVTVAFDQAREAAGPATGRIVSWREDR